MESFNSDAGLLPAATQPRKARLERARVSLQGLAMGDAFGERFFCPQDAFKAMLDQRTLPPAPWSYTDDTAMALSARYGSLCTVVCC